MFGTTAAGVVKSTIASASASVATSSWPASTSAGPEHPPTLPISGDGGVWPLRMILTRRAPASGSPLERREEVLLARPDPGRREPFGREQLGRERGDGLGVDRVDLGDQRGRATGSPMSVTSDFPSRVIRAEVDSIESSSRPFRFSWARFSSPCRRFPAAMSAICSTVISSASARFSSRVPT